MPAIDVLRQSIEVQLREIEGEMARLTAALEALDAERGPAASARENPPATRPRVSRAAPPPTERPRRSGKNRGSAKSQAPSKRPSKDTPSLEEGQRGLWADTAPEAGTDADAEAPRAGSTAAASDSATTASADEVLAALRQGRDKPSMIAEHLGVPVSLVRQRLQELEKAKRIRKRPRA